MRASKRFWNARIETASAETVKRLELRKLRAHLRYILSRSRLYKEKFRQSHVSLGQIRTLEDLGRLPFTSKEDIRLSQERRPPFGEHACVGSDEIKRVYLTSGTAGNPTFIGLTKRDLQSWVETSCRSYYAAGLRARHRLVSTLGVGPFIAGVSYDVFNRIGVSLVPVGPGRSDRVMTALQNSKADALFCTPSYAQYLVAYCKERGVDPRSFSLKHLYFGGEPGGGIPSFEKMIAESYGANVTETLGLGDASLDLWGECEAGLGMHFSGRGYIIPELVDPDTGESIEFTERARGELVYTMIERECMPLVRFRSRDEAEVTGVNKCSCGRTSPRVVCVGRLDDMFKVKGVAVYPSAVRDVIASFSPETTSELQIQLTQTEGRLVEPPVHITVEYSKRAFDVNTLKQRIEREVNRRLLFKCEVELVPEGTLPRSEYKSQLVKKL